MWRYVFSRVSKSKSQIHIIAGPTASGKSAKALELARELDGVILNCDSLQIYDALPILSAQPSANDQAQAPHKLYAHLHPNDVCSAGSWREMAEPLIADILERGQTPIICGGTGLYIKALVEGLSPIPDIPDDIRTRAIEMQKKWDAPTLHAHLKERDPVMAGRLDPNNRARLVRAWEVLEATGKSLAEWQEQPLIGPPVHWKFQIHKILPERSELHARIEQRFDQMLELGALEEAETFAEQIEAGEVEPHVPITKALGFQALDEYIKGRLSLEDARERTLAETRQYAKRQITWFRNQI